MATRAQIAGSRRLSLRGTLVHIYILVGCFVLGGAVGGMLFGHHERRERRADLAEMEHQIEMLRRELSNDRGAAHHTAQGFTGASGVPGAQEKASAAAGALASAPFTRWRAGE